jgi:hypothetical protein
MGHATSIKQKSRQHNNNKNRHPGNKKENKLVFKEQLTQRNITDNRRIGRKDMWASTATDTEPNRAYGTSKF